MEVSVKVESSLRARYGFGVTAGLYRLVCTNGLISEVLGMGRVRMNHLNYSTTKMAEFAQGLEATLESRATAPSALLDDVLDVLDRIDEEAASINRLMRTPALAIAANGAGGRSDALCDNLAALRDNTTEFSVLDLMGAHTNVANVSSNPFTVYRNADVVVGALRDMVDLVGMKHNVPTFEVN